MNNRSEQKCEPEGTPRDDVTRRSFLGMACTGALGALAAGRFAAADSREASRETEEQARRPRSKVRGIFAFDPGIDANQFAGRCRDWGIYQAILHPGFFQDDKMSRALQKQGIRLWLNLPVFYNPQYLERHPEDYAITSKGNRAIHDWCHFVCPSRERYVDELVAGFRTVLSKEQPKIVSLDFIRHYVFWEQVDLKGSADSIEDGCYCTSCLEAFEKASGEKVKRENPAVHLRANLKKQWGDWKCDRIARTAERLLGEARGLAKDAKTSIKTVPWRESELDGAIRSSAGQDVPRLARNVDTVCPMAFTQILGQTPAWKRGLLEYVRQATGKPVMSYVQAEKVIRPEEISEAQFETELKEALSEEWAGIVVFEYQQLVGNAKKAEILRKYLRG